MPQWAVMDYNTRVKIYRQSDSPTVNEDGQEVETPYLVGERWAVARQNTAVLRQKEFDVASQQVANTVWDVWMRYDSVTKDVGPQHWFVLKETNQRLNIEQAVDDQMRHIDMHYVCVERTDT